MTTEIKKTLNDHPVNWYTVKQKTNWEKALIKDFNRTVKANPNKKYILDPFVGYVER